ncbi:MAG: DNA-deoxyinosine glycosylase [Suipraeoptans sp.]
MVQRITHTFRPVYNSESRILILGTFPSVKSRENHFYYGHPRNRFWKVLAEIYENKVPETIEEKKNFLFENRTAIWDVIKSCDIVGSSDSSISNVEPNDLYYILENSKINHIFANGAKAHELYYKYIYNTTRIDAIKLPSTSPANASYSLSKLVGDWNIIRS